MLRQREVVDTRDPVDDAWSKTDEICSSCGDPLHYTEEVVQFQVCRAFNNGQQTVTFPLLNEEGDFQFEPHYLEFDCWESLVEDLREVLEDEPPSFNPNELLECSYCKSSILEWEIFATSTVGELRVSRRCPNGDSTPTFEASGTPYVTCLSCLLYQSYELDLWEEGLSQIGECEECTHAHCWRETACSCVCHVEGNDHEAPS